MTYDCVVVGAGAAGVTASRDLTDAGVEHVVLERGEVGNTWATQRWDSFRLNTPGSINVLLGDIDPQEYHTRDETVNTRRIERFMHEYIGAARERDQVFGRLRVARYHE